MTDDELRVLLQQLEPPEVPAGLRTKIFGRQRSSVWKWLSRGSIRLPVPALVCAAAAAAVFLTWYKPAPVLVVRTERVEKPVVEERVVTRERVVYRDRPVPAQQRPVEVARQGLSFHDFRPVTQLQVRIIRSGNDQ